MKKLYTLAIATLFAGASFAQSVDVSVELVSPASGSSVAPGIVSLEFNILNNGPDDIVEGDTIYFGALRGTEIVDSDGTVNSVNGIIIPAGAGSIASGGSIPWAAISAAVGGSFEVDCSGITTQAAVCALVLGIGADALTAAGDDEDPNPDNNTDCFTVDPALANIVELDFTEAVEVIFTESDIQISSELNQELNYSIVSITGQDVASGSLTNFEVISTEDWNRGVYIVRVEGAGEVTTSKVIVQ